MPDRAVEITQTRPRAMVQLKAWGEELAPASLVPAGLGGQVHVVSFCPGDWLMVSQVIDGPQLLERVRQHVRPGLAAIVDVSCTLKVIEVRGSAAAEVLAKGCGLDLHPQIFPAGRCTRTRLAQLPVIIECVDLEPRLELYVGRSYCDWLNAWLLDAAAEELGFG